MISIGRCERLPRFSWRTLPALTVGATQQMRRVDHIALPLRSDCGYVSRPTTLRHANNLAPPSDTPKPDFGYTQPAQQTARPPQTLGIGPQPSKTSISVAACRRHSRRLLIVGPRMLSRVGAGSFPPPP